VAIEEAFLLKDVGRSSSSAGCKRDAEFRRTAKSNRRSAEIRALTRNKILRHVVVYNPSIGQGQVGEEMVGTDDPVHRKVRHRRFDVRHEVQPAGARSMIP
jgi:hypothetical protein